MSLRRQFVLVFVAFSAIVSSVGGWMANRAASSALERELDDKLTQVASAAAETGLRGDEILLFRPGDEGSPAWEAIHQRIRRLKRFVDEAYILRSDLRALVTTLPADSVPVGTPLRELAPYALEIQEARERGEATSPLFAAGGRFFKYGFVRLEQTDAILAVRMPANYMEPLEEFQRSVWAGAFLAAVVAALIAWLLAATVTRPLERLGRAALRIQRGRLDEPVVGEWGGELRRLSRAMERMRAGILQRDEQLRLMLAQVAHEIRNPLGGLELFASAAAESEDSLERIRLIEKVRGEVRALNRIIDDFLTFSRPPVPDSTLHDVRKPVLEAAELVGIEMKGGSGGLSVHLPQEPLPARADPEHVKRVLLNLLRNAAQAGKRVEVRGEAVRGEVLLIVRDDGPGIAQELRERIFDPFVTDKEKGAGLGLAIVKRVVEANGGRVEVVPPPEAGGGGAEFRVYFRGAEDLLPS